MYAHFRRFGSMFSSYLVILSLCLLAFSEVSHAADKKEGKKATPKATRQSTPAPAKTPRAKASTKSSKSSAKATPKTPPPLDEATVHSSFDVFAQEWMTKLAEAEEYHRTKQVKVTEGADGFTAEYLGYLPQRSIEIRKTEYKDTPFVGTLSYYERTLRSTGKTKEQALQGPFEQVGTSPVREIFRFTKGKWVY